MIKLFVSDIDGCLAEPYRPYPLDVLQQLARYAAEAGPVGSGGVAPALTLCSGRPYPYVEAMTQVLGLTTPVLFESGGGMFDPVKAQTTWNPRFTDEVAEQVQKVRRWMAHTCVPGTSLALDHAKRTQAGVIGPDVEEVMRLVPVVEAFVAEHAPALRVFYTDVSIDVVPPDITKKQGLGWLAEVTGVALEAMAYIGDTNGDLEALQTIGFSFAPANATGAVRRAVQQVTEGLVTQGTLEAYRWCMARNEALLVEAS